MFAFSCVSKDADLEQTFFVGMDPSGAAPHPHHCSFEVNDFDSEHVGHEHLLSKGWTNVWGIGRHLLGSQIFDYW